MLASDGYAVGHFGKWHLGSARRAPQGAERWFGLLSGYGTHGRFTFADNGKPVKISGWKSRIFTDQAIDWIRADHAGRPWLTFVSLTSTHAPHRGLPERLVQPYRGKVEKLIPYVPPPREVFRPLPREDVPEAQAQYLASATDIDEQLGRLIDAIDYGDRDALESTLIIYASDHGLHAGQLGYWVKGDNTRPLNMYERSIRVPTLLRYPPAIRAGQVRDDLVDHCDLFQTVLDLAGCLPTAEQRQERRYQGQSYAATLAAGNPQWRDAQFGDYGPVRMIRTATHKLLRRHGHGVDQLFNLTIDPDERRNVIADPANASLVAQLDARLDAFFAQIDAAPAKSGLAVRERVGQFNPVEPWHPQFDRWPAPADD